MRAHHTDLEAWKIDREWGIVVLGEQIHMYRQKTKKKHVLSTTEHCHCNPLPGFARGMWVHQDEGKQI